MDCQSSDIAIFLVEDDDIDAQAVERAFRRKHASNPIVRTRDGLEALSVLRGESSVKVVKRPYLILLDLNMPRLNGIEFLQELRRDEMLRDSIVFVLTTSDDDRDVLQAYEQRVAGYLVKSKVGEDLDQVATMLDLYWRSIQFPPSRN